MDNNEFNIIQSEKNKLHIKYIIAIAIIICFGSIILATYNQKAFVEQISFAGTVTSIILSVLAIWMSISGERTLNDIKSKIVESTERLSVTTINVEHLNNNYEKMMDEQFKELKNFQTQLESLIGHVDIVGKKVSIVQEKVDNNYFKFDSVNNDILEEKQKLALFNNVYNWIFNNHPNTLRIFCIMVQTIILCIKQNRYYTYEEVINALANCNVNISFCMKIIDINWGIIDALSLAAVFTNSDTINEIDNMVTNFIRSGQN